MVFYEELMSSVDSRKQSKHCFASLNTVANMY